MAHGVGYLKYSLVSVSSTPCAMPYAINSAFRIPPSAFGSLLRLLPQKLNRLLTQNANGR